MFQQNWNQQSGKPDLWDVNDFDVFYFDEEVSSEAENRVIEQVSERLGPLLSRVDIRKQAHLHLWYEERCGSSILRFNSSRDGIDRFLITCTSVGIEVSTGNLYALYGLTDLWNGISRVNAANSQPDLFRIRHPTTNKDGCGSLLSTNVLFDSDKRPTA